MNRELQALRRTFKLACGAPPLGETLLPTMPSITLLREDNVREGFIEAADFDAFLTALRRSARPSSRTWPSACSSTCLRTGNVANLTWAVVTPEVDGGVLVGGELRLPGTAMKNNRPLTLPLSGRLLDLFARRWAQRLPNCPFVFHRFGGRRVSRFDAPWKAAAAAIGQPNLLRHDLRRSGCPDAHPGRRARGRGDEAWAGGRRAAC